MRGAAGRQPGNACEHAWGWSLAQSQQVWGKQVAHQVEARDEDAGGGNPQHHVAEPGGGGGVAAAGGESWGVRVGREQERAAACFEHVRSTRWQVGG